MNARHQDAFKLPLAALCLSLACSRLQAASLHESRSATCTPARSLGDRRESGVAFPVEHLRVLVRDECERCAVCRRRAVTAWAIWVSPLPSSARSAHGATHRDATTSPSRTPSGVPQRPAQPAPNHEVSRASAKRGRGAREHGLGGRSAPRRRPKGGEERRVPPPRFVVQRGGNFSGEGGIRTLRPALAITLSGTRLCTPTLENLARKDSDRSLRWCSWVDMSRVQLGGIWAMGGQRTRLREQPLVDDLW